MPSTDIDGTPILILGADEVARLRHLIRTESTWSHTQREIDFFRAKFKAFINDPQVIEWAATRVLKNV